MAGVDKTAAPAASPQASAGASQPNEELSPLQKEKNALESAIRLLKLDGKTPLDVVADKTNTGAILYIIEADMEELGVEANTPEWEEALKDPQYHQKLSKRLETRLEEVKEEMAPPVVDSVELIGNLCPAVTRDFGLVIEPDCKGAELDVNLRVGSNYLQTGYRYDQFSRNPTGQEATTIHRHSVVLGSFERYHLLFGINRVHGARIMPTVTQASSAREDSEFSLDVGTRDGINMPLPFNPVGAMSFSIGQSVGILGDASPYEMTMNLGFVFPEDRGSYIEEQLRSAEQSLKDLESTRDTNDNLDSPEMVANWEEKVKEHATEKEQIAFTLKFLEDDTHNALDILDDEKGRFTEITNHVDELFKARGFKLSDADTTKGEQELESAAFRQALVAHLQERARVIDDDIPPDPREIKAAKVSEFEQKLELAKQEVAELEKQLNVSRAISNAAYAGGRSMVSYELAQRSSDLYRLGGQVNSGPLPLPVQLDLLDAVWNKFPATLAYQKMMGQLPLAHALWVDLSSIAAGGLMTWGGIQTDDSALYGQGNFLLANGLAALPQTWKGGRESVFQRAAVGTLVVAGQTAAASLLIKNKDTRAFGMQMPGQTAGIFLIVGSEAIDALTGKAKPKAAAPEETSE